MKNYRVSIILFMLVITFIFGCAVYKYIQEVDLDRKIEVAFFCGQQGVFILCDYYSDTADKLLEITEVYIKPALSDITDEISITKLIEDAIKASQTSEKDAELIIYALGGAVTAAELLIEDAEDYKKVTVAFFDGISTGCDKRYEVRNEMLAKRLEEY